MKILTRYIFKELLGPTTLGFLFYTFIILMRQLFDLAGMIITRSLPVSTILELLLLSLPNIIVLTLPMSLLFGILIAVGRLSADSEIIAMRALGISMRTIHRPVFIFSFLMLLLNFYLMNVVLPRGNTELVKLRAEVFTSQIEKEIRPKVFYDDYENLMIYVNDVDPRTGQWHGVFVADSRSEDSEQHSPTAGTTPQQLILASRAHESTTFAAQRSTQRIIVAKSGTLSIIKQSKQVWMNLHDADTHFWDPRKPDRYDLNHNGVQRMRLPDRFTTDASGLMVRSLRELNLIELLEQARLSKGVDPEINRLAWVEIHKKFAIPFACIVFGMLGLPLGITNRRGGKSSGFSLSIAIIMFYYVMINNGEHLAAGGKVSPAIGMWGANVLLLAAGIFLLTRANRDAGAQRDQSGWWQRLLTRIALRQQKRAEERSAVRGTDEPEDTTILGRLDITFPNILDRYVMREFVKVLALVIGSVVALGIIADYNGMAKDINQNHIPFSIVLAYYRFNVFQIVDYALPISVLAATLITFGLLSKNNEVTALKSSGVSLYRVAFPVVATAILMSVLSYLMLDYVLPYSNRRAEEMHNLIKARNRIATPHQQRLWFLGHGRYIINFLAYDRVKKQLSQVQVFELHPTEFRITRRVYADLAIWDGRGWVFEHGWIRSFSDDGLSATFSPIVAPLRLFYSERPEDFETEAKAPETMTFVELRRYIETIRRSGYAAEKLSVKLYQKTSWPFITLVMALIALPFAFRVGKRGALYGVGIALVLAIFYYLVYATFSKFGEVGNLPPLVAAWSANILFAIAATYLFLHVET
jgi:LPS export ABC transporter permease LptG/LPS export ABC transporter permease LptF